MRQIEGRSCALNLWVVDIEEWLELFINLRSGIAQNLPVHIISLEREAASEPAGHIHLERLLTGGAEIRQQIRPQAHRIAKEIDGPITGIALIVKCQFAHLAAVNQVPVGRT